MWNQSSFPECVVIYLAVHSVGGFFLVGEIFKTLLAIVGSVLSKWVGKAIPLRNWSFGIRPFKTGVPGEIPFYMASSEIITLKDVRSCYFIKKMVVKVEDWEEEAMLIKVEPELPFLDYATQSYEYCSLTVVVPHYSESTLFPINFWPMPVNLFHILNPNIEKKEFVERSDWKPYSGSVAELYRTREEAEDSMRRIYGDRYG